MTLPPIVRAIVDAALDPTVVIDSNLVLVHANRAFTQLVGVKPRELSTRDVVAPCHSLLELSLCRERCPARAALAADRAVRFDEVAGREQAVFVVSSLPLPADGDAPRLVMESYRDVTAESRMQAGYRVLLEQQRRQNELLQEEVDRRTSDLQRSLRELQDARAQLVESEKLSSLGVLVAGVAHELNNPINFIYANLDFVEEHAHTLLGAVGALLEGAPATSRAALEQLLRDRQVEAVREDLPQLLGTMREGAERVANIISDLRVYSHGGTAQLEAYNLNRGIELTLRLLRPQAQGRVELRTELGGVGPLQCRGTQINQVIMNLVANAIQAIPGRGTVTVRSGEDAAQVWFEVQDDGEGISPALREKIFDPFFTTKPVGKGTGLGLAISRRIIEGHGGEIAVESEAGKGARFRVVLRRQPL